jgi:hypothetical protein
MDIIDQMDAARFSSANANKYKKKVAPKNDKDHPKKGTQMVLRNLNNQ